jgi:hypothetical protein
MTTTAHAAVLQGRQSSNWLRARRRLSFRAGPFLAIVAAHAALVSLVVESSREIVRAPETERLVSVFLRPRVIVSQHSSTDPPVIRVPSGAPILYDSSATDAPRSTVAVIGVGTRAPQVVDAPLDAAPFARSAGLQPGHGAAVVLRIEVLGTGDLGAIIVEASGGTDAIDAAAIDYVRALTWSGGMVDGKPATIWIRWGVWLPG